MVLREKRRTNRPNRRLIPFSMPDMKSCWVRKSEYGCLHRLLYTNTFGFYMCVDGIYSRIICDSNSWRIWKRDAVACRRLRCWNQAGVNGCIILNGTGSYVSKRWTVIVDILDLKVKMRLNWIFIRQYGDFHHVPANPHFNYFRRFNKTQNMPENRADDISLSFRHPLTTPRIFVCLQQYYACHPLPSACVRIPLRLRLVSFPYRDQDSV